MNKQEFIAALQSKLGGLPRQDVDERIDFYAEMIDDCMEEGMTEEEAVVAIGSVDVIAEQILSDIPLVKIAKEKIRPKKRLGTGEIVLLAVGSPLWLALVAAVLAVMLSVYAALWSVVVSLWSAFGAVVGCALCGVMAGVGFAVGGYEISGIAMIGAGLVCAGLAIFLFLGCRAATKGVLLLSKKIALGMKKWFVKKEEA